MYIWLLHATGGAVKACELVMPSVSCRCCKNTGVCVDGHPCLRQCCWYAGDMLGLGALTLPSVFARLGWLPACVLLAVCALGALMSGRLFARMAQQVWQAHCAPLRRRTEGHLI